MNIPRVRLGFTKNLTGRPERWSILIDKRSSVQSANYHRPSSPSFRLGNHLRFRAVKPYPSQSLALASRAPSIRIAAMSTSVPQEGRLPTNVYPSHYDLVIKTDNAGNPPNYSGELLITLEVREDTSSLHLNVSKNLKVTHMAITTNDLKSQSALSIPTSSMKVDEEEEVGVIDLSSLPGGGLKAGTKDAKIWMRFDSELLPNMIGYYRSDGDLDETTGKKPIYALTQFEPACARKAFPCWDEPLIKSKFTLTMIAPEHETVLSNMPETASKPWTPSSDALPENALSASYQLGSCLNLSSASGKTSKTETGSGAWKITNFETTPMMSSYLVAWACGVFESLSSEHKSVKGNKTVPLRIFATPNLIKQAQFGLDIKKWALPVYEEIFDIPFALPKLDTLVAHDFDAGAMENWGLITGRTTAYLIDPEKSSLVAQKRVASVQCHELAHMWFGDIVTMKWWDNLWLNESFATLMGELVIMDRIWPEWKPRADFLNAHLSRALELDSQRSSHPIEAECKTVGMVNQIFDGISYSKGASVLRMLSAVVGESTFLKGVSIYLKKHLYSNAETKDLWDGISEASGVNVAEMMASWTLKVGFPVITVEETGSGKIKVTQNRFLSTADAKPEEDETLWYVPLEIKKIENGKTSIDHKAVLKERSATFDVGSADFKLNAETVGVYRVKYSPERLSKLSQDATSLTCEDRVGLVSDAATLARAGLGKTSASMTLISGLAKEEDEYLVWAQITGALGSINAVLWEESEDVKQANKKLQRTLCRPMVDKLGYEHGPNDAPDVKELRALVIGACSNAEDTAVVKELCDRFEPFLKNGDDSRIPPDLQRSIFSTAVKNLGEPAFVKLQQVVEKPPNPSSKVDAMVAICQTRDETLLKKAFDMLDNGEVKDQDWYIFFRSFGGNPMARRAVGDFFKSHYKLIHDKFAETYGMSYMVKASFDSLTTQKDHDEVKEYFSKLDTKKFQMPVSQTLDSIQASADWLKRDKEDILEWLKANKYL